MEKKGSPQNDVDSNRKADVGSSGSALGEILSKEEVQEATPSDKEDTRNRPPGVKRLLVTFSILLSLILGLPVWWKSTRIYRAPLPFAEIEKEALLASSQPLVVPLHIHVILAASQVEPPDWTKEVDPEVLSASIGRQLSPAPGASEPGKSEPVLFTVSVTVVTRHGCSSCSSPSATCATPSPSDLHDLEQSSRREQEEAAEEVGANQSLASRTGASAIAGGDRWPCGLVHSGLAEAIGALDADLFDDWLANASRRSTVSVSGQEAGWEGGKGAGHYTVLVTDGDSSQAIESSAGEGAGGEGRRDVSPTDTEAEEKGQVDKPGKLRGVLGKYRHAWIEAPGLTGGKIDWEVVPLVVHLAQRYFDQGGMGGGSGEGQRQEPKEEGIASMPLAADGSAVLSFSLLNAHPQGNWMFSWDFAGVEQQFLRPITEALAPVARLSVESQVLYFTPKGAEATWNPKTQTYEVAASDWPFFVNSNEWHLDTSTAATGRSKILHFVLYIPAQSECPLGLRLRSGRLSPTNAFTSPTWGGVSIWNPPSCNPNDTRPSPPHQNRYSTPTLGGVADIDSIFEEVDQGVKGGESEIGEGRRWGSEPRLVSVEELGPFMGVVVAQLRTLLGLPSGPPSDARRGVSSVPEQETGFAQWEVDALLRRRAREDSMAAASSLTSLSKLVQSLPSMVIKDEIRQQVAGALAATRLAREKANEAGAYEEAAAAARSARAQAEEAFFDPTMMSLLYFPLEHHLAVYTPFFVPVIMHVLVAFAKECLRCSKEWRKYRRFVERST